MTGISYNGMDSSGNVDWYGLANIHLIKHEMGLTLQVGVHGVMRVCSCVRIDMHRAAFTVVYIVEKSILFSH